MTKISIRDAVAKFQVSRPAITKSLNNGNISGEKNSKGVWMIETSELSRVYKARTPLHDKEHPNLTAVNTGENTLENHYMKGKLEAWSCHGLVPVSFEQCLL